MSTDQDYSTDIRLSTQESSERALGMGFCSSSNGRPARFSPFSLDRGWYGGRRIFSDNSRKTRFGPPVRRLMPDTVQRCVDTVVIQRGGARR